MVVDLSTQIFSILVGVTSLIFSTYTFYNYFKKKRMGKLFLALFLLSNFFVYFFATFRLYFAEQPEIDGFIWLYGSILSGMGTILFFFLLSIELIVRKNMKNFFTVLTILFVIFTYLSFLFLPAERVESVGGVEWIPSSLSRITLLITLVVLLLVGVIILIFGIRQKVSRFIIYGIGQCFVVVGLGLDGLGFEVITLPRFFNLIGCILMFYSFVGIKKK